MSVEPYDAVAQGCRYCRDGGDCDETCGSAKEAQARELAPWLFHDRDRLEGVAALVWRWRKEADETQGALEFDQIAETIRSCADELAHSIPAALVAAAGRASV